MPARPVAYDPAMDATVERLTGHALSESVSVGGTRPRKGQFMDRRTRKTIEKLAKRLGITPKPTWTDFELWGHIYERTRGGIQRTSDTVLGDPFCLFVTGYCDDGHDPHKMTLVAKKPGGVAFEEMEGKKEAQRIRENFPPCEATLPSGEPCGKTLHRWMVDMTRMSVFQDAERERARGPR